MKRISGKESFNDVLTKYPEIEELLLEKGMSCAKCPMSAEESIEEGAKAHAIDSKELIKEINERLKKKS